MVAVSLELSARARGEIEEHARSAYPEECCGVLIGTVPEGFGSPKERLSAEEARRLGNAWEGTRANRYLADPAAFARIERELSGSPRGILGIYHSHPDAPAWPSPFDLERAWPGYAYLILSVRKAAVEGGRVWRLSEDGRSFLEGEVSS